jgi:hypothetical protein
VSKVSPRELRHERPAYVAVVLDFGKIPGMREANARRLKASWNVLEGVSTDEILHPASRKKVRRPLTACLIHGESAAVE